MLAGAALLFWIAVLATGKDWRDALHILEGEAKVKSQDRVIAYAHWGLYWGCLLDAVLCTGLGATARWWAAAVRPGQAVKVARLSRIGWVALFTILVLAGTVRWLRLDLSLYNDEAHNFRRYFSGYFQQRTDGTSRWREPSWGETLWLNQVGNNSTPFSVSARLSHAAALRLTGARWVRCMRWGCVSPPGWQGLSPWWWFGFCSGGFFLAALPAGGACSCWGCIRGMCVIHQRPGGMPS